MPKKLKNFNCFLVLFGVIAALVFCANFKVEIYYATTSSPDITRSTYKDYDFDLPLFEAVFAMAKQLNCNQPLIGRGFDVDLFLLSSTPSYIENGVGTTGYEENVEARNQIVNDLRVGVLDLTTGQNAKYDCLKNVSPLQSLTGLNSMSLSFVKKLFLNNNEIASIKPTDLEQLTNLQELYLQNNKLTNFGLNTSINNLTLLNLSNNLLQTINLSTLRENATVILSNNDINSINDITFLSNNKNLSNLDLDFNMLTNLTEQDVSFLNSKVQNNVNIGVQGFSNAKQFTAGDLLKIYNFPTNTLQNLTVQISYFEGNSNLSKSTLYNESNNNVICTSALSETESIYLPAGRIKIEFFSNNTKVNESLYPNYSSKILDVNLPSLKYTILVNGEEKQNTYQENDFILEFYFEEDENIPNLQDILQHAKIFSNVENQAESENSNILISSNGTFNCSAYVLFDNIKSNTTTLQVTRRYVTGIVIGIVIIITIIVLIGAGYFIVRWYRGGAMVAPLSEKELVSVNRRKNKKDEQIKEIVIRGSGKERLFTTKNEDEVLDNLNSKREISSYYNAHEEGDYNKQNYAGTYRSVTNNFDRYSTEEFKNNFNDTETSNYENDNLTNDLNNNTNEDNDVEG